MRVMLAAFAATIIIAFAANFVLGEFGFSSQERYASDNVRLE